MGKKLSVSMGLILIIMILVSGSGVVYLTASTEQGVVLSVEPETDVICGDSFTVAINIINAKDLNKWEMRISWDASIIELDPPHTGAVEEGSFLRGAGATKFEVASYNSGSGVLLKIACSMLQAKGASGSGTLLRLRFKAIAPGETPIIISESRLHDFVLRTIPHTCNQGEIPVGSALRDIAILSFNLPINVALDKPTQLNVTIENKGANVEINVEVRIYVNNSLKHSTTIPELPIGTPKLLHFGWTPSSLGTCNVTAYAVPMLGETTLNNNQKTVIVEVVSHDLAVVFEPELPGRIILDQSISLNATVKNLGSVKETNVNMTIFVNSVPVESKVFQEITSGYQAQICYQWAPNALGTFNITAYVYPVVGERNLVNNVQSGSVLVVASLESKGILIVSGDSGAWCDKGTSLIEFESALQWAGYEYDVWKKSVQGRPSLETLLNYEVVVWTVGDYSSISLDRVDGNILKEYLAAGGNVLIEGENIAHENYPAYSGLQRTVLHIGFQGSKSLAPGLKVTDHDHPITSGLPSNFAWKTQPRAPDEVEPAYGAYAIVRYNSEIRSFAAVVVFDGTQEGIGSVVYFPFTAFSLPDNTRNVLISNSIDWLMRFGVSTVGSRIIHCRQNSVYFIYADPSQVSVEETFGMVAGAMVFALCKESRNQGFTTTPQWLLQSGEVNSTHIDDAIVAMSGHPIYHAAIRYYENTGLTPAKFYQNSTHYMFMDQTGKMFASLSIDVVNSGREDMFIIYTFNEGNVDFLVMYGFRWRGTWAAGIFFAETIAKNFQNYSDPIYIYHWIDGSEGNPADGIPQFSEIHTVTSDAS